jgi:hypothetical protein
MNKNGFLESKEDSLKKILQCERKTDLESYKKSLKIIELVRQHPIESKLDFPEYENSWLPEITT